MRTTDLSDNAAISSSKRNRFWSVTKTSAMSSCTSTAASSRLGDDCIRGSYRKGFVVVDFVPDPSIPAAASGMRCLCGCRDLASL